MRRCRAFWKRFHNRVRSSAQRVLKRVRFLMASKNLVELLAKADASKAVAAKADEADAKATTFVKRIQAELVNAEACEKKTKQVSVEAHKKALADAAAAVDALKVEYGIN